MELGIVRANGSTYDPKRTYEIDFAATQQTI